MSYDGPIPHGVPSGGTGNTTFTAYSIICAGTTATGAFQNVSGVGTSGQALSSAGAAALPAWSSALNLVLIQTQNPSSVASVTFTTGITTTYNNYILYFSNILAATNAVTMELQWSTNGGSSYIATGYLSGIDYAAYTTSLSGNINATTYVYLNNTTSSTVPFDGKLNLLEMTSSKFPIVNGLANRSDGFVFFCGSTYNTNAIVNAMKIVMSSGNVAAGKISLYGVLNA